MAVQELTVQELSGSLAIILTSLTTRPTYNPGALKVTAGLEESDDSLLLGLYGFGHLQESCSRSDEHWNDAHIQCGTFIFFLLQDNLGRPVPERQTILKILLQQEMMELAMVTDSWNSVRCAKFQVTWSDHHTSTNTFYRPDALMQGC